MNEGLEMGAGESSETQFSAEKIGSFHVTNILGSIPISDMAVDIVFGSCSL